MYFPWVGLFEQIRLADVYVHYDDVAFARGSFVNRVQVKSPAGSKWMTIPLRGQRLGDSIGDLEADESTGWRRRHVEQLKNAYRTAPYRDEMLDLVQRVLQGDFPTLVDRIIAGIDSVCQYFGIRGRRVFTRSSGLNIAGSSWSRVLAIAQHFSSTTYVTGHGARNYLNHQAFEEARIAVRYMRYERRPYRQCHGSFDPHVSVLDLIANEGRGGAEYLLSSTEDWRRFVAAA